MAKCYEIKDLQTLLGEKSILNYSTKLLTATGDNFGSILVILTVTLENRPELNYVVKLSPVNEFFITMFETPLTFWKEIGWYETIVPTLKKFYRDQGVEFFNFSPKCYGTRISVNPDAKKVDKDAAIVLENLKIAGYEMLNKFEGLNMECSQLVAENLAVFHASTLAVKLLKPASFHEKIMPYLRQPLGEFSGPTFLEVLIESAELDEKSAPFVDAIKKSYNERKRNYCNEPFATITHNDMWMNNLLFKLKDGKPQCVKFLDYQFIDYGSPAKDLLLFLFVAVNPTVLKANYDELVKVYFETFVKTLKKLKCNATPFTWEGFQNEMKIAARTELFHILMMLCPTLISNIEVDVATEFSEDLLKLGNYHSSYTEKFRGVLLAFQERGWIIDNF